MSADTPVAIGLSAVIAVIDSGEPKILCVKAPAGREALPYGPFDPARHRTFEIGLRDWVSRKTQVDLGYVEQLYTFGDQGRDAPAAALEGGGAGDRVVSVGYLALVAAPPAFDDHEARWRSWYDFFPWEDWRTAEPASLADAILPALGAWAARAGDPATRSRRTERIRLAFGLAGVGWEEERALDRYELMYEAGLVEEAWRDRVRAGLPEPAAPRSIAANAGAPMASDHRRILATAIGRLRGKLKYRAVIFDLMPKTFTLLALQRAVEAIVGFSLHKQNFRRSIESSGLVAPTGATVRQESGRPAALFDLAEAARLDRAARGLTIPRLRRSPGG